MTVSGRDRSATAEEEGVDLEVGDAMNTSFVIIASGAFDCA